MKLGIQYVGGVEFNETPLPEKLVKAMKREWAEKLRDSGEIMLHTSLLFCAMDELMEIDHGI